MPIIAITGALDSPLARVAAVVLDGVGGRGGVSPRPGAHGEHDGRHGAGRCARGGAAGGARDSAAEDFAALHPGGSLGRRLLLRVRDVMLPPGRILRRRRRCVTRSCSLAHDRGLALVGDGRTARGCPHHRRPDAPRRARSRLSRPSGGAGHDPTHRRPPAPTTSRRPRSARWSATASSCLPVIYDEGSHRGRGAPARSHAGGGGVSGPAGGTAGRRDSAGGALSRCPPSCSRRR